MYHNPEKIEYCATITSQLNLWNLQKLINIRNEHKDNIQNI